MRVHTPRMNFNVEKRIIPLIIIGGQFAVSSSWFLQFWQLNKIPPVTHVIYNYACIRAAIRVNWLNFRAMIIMAGQLIRFRAYAEIQWFRFRIWRTKSMTMTWMRYVSYIFDMCQCFVVELDILLVSAFFVCFQSIRYSLSSYHVHEMQYRHIPIQSHIHNSVSILFDTCQTAYNFVKHSCSSMNNRVQFRYFI